MTVRLETVSLIERRTEYPDEAPWTCYMLSIQFEAGGVSAAFNSGDSKDDVVHNLRRLVSMLEAL